MRYRFFALWPAVFTMIKAQPVKRRAREYPHRESNPDQQVRKLLFYPLNYGDISSAGANVIICSEMNKYS